MEYCFSSESNNNGYGEYKKRILFFLPEKVIIIQKMETHNILFCDASFFHSTAAS